MSGLLEDSERELTGAGLVHTRLDLIALVIRQFDYQLVIFDGNI